ncbi:MAG TPA: hypothetical protein VM308_10070 [Sphingomicrobium sp.]|nr:hypothetical protein [Sphingomicrobium sp.]
MGLWESALATAILAGLLYIVDRGIAFHVGLYSAIASGRKFAAEQAYREMDNPFATAPKLLSGATFLAVAIVLGLDGIRSDWEVIVIVGFAVIYAYLCWSAATKAFQKTSFGNWMNE